MRTQTGVLFTAGFLLSALLVAPLAAAENEGQADLDRAIELKLTAESLAEWGTVIDLCQSAINKGLDKENQDFCKQLLSSTLLQRAELIGTRLLQMSPEEIGVQGAVVWRMAIKDIERSVEIDPKQAASQLWLGKLHAMQGGDRKTARKALDQAIRLAGDDRTTKAEALRWRAQIKENLDERLKDLSEAVELAPQNIEILRLRGATHLAAGKADAALADFDAALAIDTDDPGAHEGRGMTLEALKRYDEASESYLRLGKLHAMQGGNRKTARKALDRAIRLAGDDRATKAEALRWRAQIRENLDERLKDLSEAVELAPQNAEFLRLRGATHLATGNADEALADFDAALAIDTDDPAAHEGRGMTLEALKRYDEARENYQRAAQLAPGNAIPLLQQARVSALAGKNEQALADFDAALAIDAKNAVAHEGRGMTLEALKRYDEARESYGLAAELVPGNVIPLL
ncbi:MAG TPA: tetratricopeptide repeat protein, partial [Pirellulales bacterium]|nr:tetratricopeptide repeat protein [Pirellulales bacterium]